MRLLERRESLSGPDSGTAPYLREQVRRLEYEIREAERGLTAPRPEQVYQVGSVPAVDETLDPELQEWIQREIWGDGPQSSESTGSTTPRKDTDPTD